MGSRTDYEIAADEPATGERAELLEQISQLAFELIKRIELERVGVYAELHGDDPVLNTMSSMRELFRRYAIPYKGMW